MAGQAASDILHRPVSARVHQETIEQIPNGPGSLGSFRAGRSSTGRWVRFAQGGSGGHWVRFAEGEDGSRDVDPGEGGRWVRFFRRLWSPVGSLPGADRPVQWGVQAVPERGGLRGSMNDLLRGRRR